MMLQLNNHLSRRFLKMHPAALVLMSFAAAIGVGTLLLMTPAATTSGSIAFIDSLFTATSAVCVTGLIVVDTGTYFTVFGQWVILFLIQIGGLGVMTISVALFRLIGRNISYHQRMAVQDVFTHTPREDIYSLLLSTILFTAVVETAGALLLFYHWQESHPLGEALYLSIFHAISAFCNAGFSLFADSLMAYRGNSLLNGVIGGLIVIGGLGFPVLYDLYSRMRKVKGRRPRLSIQTRTVLFMTVVLILGGALLFGSLERRTLLAYDSWPERLLVPIFQSITCRTAGFNTVEIGTLNDATLTLMLFLMFFGASPGSAGGGVKTTTLAVIAAFTFSRIRKMRRVNMFKKSLPPETISRSISLIVLALAAIAIGLFLILAGNTGRGNLPIGRSASFLSFLFETVSAFGTVGLSMGATSLLNTWGKLWIIVLMFVGRVGVLTLSYIVVGYGAVRGIEYAEENIMIG